MLVPGPLVTPDAVIAASGVGALARYYDVLSLDHASGFSVRRDYPERTPLAGLRTPSGIKNYVVLIHFVVSSPTAHSGIQSVHLSAQLRGDREEEHRFAVETYKYSDPDCPTPEAVRIVRRLSPLTLDFPDDFRYDAAEGQFYAETGPVAGETMLDFVYETHCHTLRRSFRLKWWSKQKARAIVQGTVWSSEKIALWLLKHGYDVVPKTGERQGRERFLSYGPFHCYKLAEFERISDTSGTSFFGLPSSSRRLFSNTLLLGLACLAIFFFARQHPLTQAIYGNTA